MAHDLLLHFVHIFFFSVSGLQLLRLHPSSSQNSPNRILLPNLFMPRYSLIGSLSTNESNTYLQCAKIVPQQIGVNASLRKDTEKLVKCIVYILWGTVRNLSHVLYTFFEECVLLNPLTVFHLSCLSLLCCNTFSCFWILKSIWINFLLLFHLVDCIFICLTMHC